MKYITILITLTFLTGCAGMFSEEKKEEWFRDKVSKELALSETQKSHFDILISELKNHRSKKEKNHKEFIVFFDSKFKKDEAQKYIDSELEKFKNASQELLPKVAKFYDSLDNSQKAKFKEHFNEYGHKSRRHRRRH